MHHAEPLFLVHDQQAEIAKLHVLRQQAVRADDDFDLGGREVFERLFLLGLRAKSADHVDSHRERGEPLAERLHVLEREHRRRREKRDLLAVHDGLERRAHRDFGLAVAHIAAEQTVHGRRRLHVALDVGDGGRLVGREVVRKGVFELLLPVRIRAEGVARDGLARGVELEQLFRHVAHRLLDARLGPLPRRAAQAIDRRTRCPGVLLDEVESFHRNEQLVLAGIAQLHEFLGRFASADPICLRPTNTPMP